MNANELERRFRVRLSPSPLLVTFHPVTLEFERTADHLDALTKALVMAGRPVVFTSPNADTKNELVRRSIEAYLQSHPESALVENLGADGYFAMMRHAAAMVGNSSSGIIEAPSCALPVVNIGTRQAGRLRARNVIDVGYDPDDIVRAIESACSAEFRRTLEGLKSPYDHGGAAAPIVERLASVEIGETLLHKSFQDLGSASCRENSRSA